ncbi:competence type IV pilus major pilin ComGC [Pseudogracilibacillus sp. SE30717A]|uniref:competence type IV pilus major pilin ComGC n=1 Tax=Pseudogracilibacillus sp. SE30717A TaxID=3098293 RepID=UPI00300E02D1
MYKKEDAFTLIEMLIVLTIITVLILLVVPNLTDKSTTIHDRGCEALVQTVQAQVGAYQLDKGKKPNSLDELRKEDYIKEDQKQCKNGNTLSLNSNGTVIVNETN